MLIGFAIGALLSGIFTIFGTSAELGDLERLSIRDALTITGTLDIPKHSGRSTVVSIREPDGTEWKCYIGHCGYPEIRGDLGKLATARILEGKIAQIEIDGIVRLTKDRVVAGHQSTTKLGFWFIGLGVVLLCLGIFIRRKTAAAGATHALT